jgi:hypothetical protein
MSQRERTVARTAIAVMSAFLVGLFSLATVEALEIGEWAPDFDLPATTGSNIKLSQFLGKQAVLVEFYGADFAPV